MAERIGLVLAGGGARGAYEMGVLSVLLPWLEREHRQRPDVVAGEIDGDHVRASAAIPALFPAVEVERPGDAAGWYFDGGTRLNTPIKPALALGAQRLIVVGLNSLSRAPTRDRRPDLFDAAGE